MFINGYFIGFAGSSDRDDANKYKILAKTIGEEIVKRGHRFLCGGCSGGLTEVGVKQATKFLSTNQRQEEIAFRIISIIPDTDLEEYPTISVGHILSCQKTNRDERRFFMASMMDSLITIRGGGGTGKEIQACLDVGTPVIPIWHTGGASQDKWNNIRSSINEDHCYKGRVIKKIEELERTDANNQKKMGELAVDIAIELAKRKHKYRCSTTASKRINKTFIVMPFHEKFDEVYRAIKDVFENKIYSLPVKFECIRHDEVLSGRIDETLVQNLSQASLLIVDATGNNPNVLFESGIGIGFNTKQIIINQNPKNSVVDIANEIQIKYNLSDLDKLKTELVKRIQAKFA